MKILIVSRSFYPENSPRSFRTTELALELRNRGHQVTVAIPHNYIPTLKEQRFDGLLPLDLGEVYWPEIATSNSSRIISLTRRAIRRSLNLLLAYPELELRYRVIRALSKASAYDLAISIAAPHSIHWGFSYVRKKNPRICRTWVADCGDPFVGVTIDTFKKPFYFSWIERDFCRHTDFISVPIETAKQAYLPEFHTKIKVIPQGLRIPPPEAMPKYRPNPIPTFVFSGSFMPGIRDPRPLLDYLCQFERPFCFICYTKQPEMFAQYSEKLGDKLCLRPYVPREHLLTELAKADFLVNLENGTDRQLPSKLIDYSIASRPIISINSQCPDFKAMEEFLEGNYTRQMAVSDASNFDISKVAAQFEALHLSRNQSSYL
jgi:hypothetical protein